VSTTGKGTLPYNMIKYLHKKKTKKTRSLRLSYRHKSALSVGAKELTGDINVSDQDSSVRVLDRGADSHPVQLILLYFVEGKGLQTQQMSSISRMSASQTTYLP
jgi:hypothetical protein